MLASGASGGRKILPAVLQSTLFAHHYHLPIDQLLHQGRIDTSNSEQTLIDSRLERDIVESIKAYTPAIEYSGLSQDYGYGVVSMVMKDGQRKKGAVCPYFPLCSVKGF